MGEKRMLIVPADLVRKIDENRGDMTQAEFIEFMIDSRLKDESKPQPQVAREEFHAFQEDIRKLLKSFLDFFLTYGLELGKDAPRAGLEELTGRLKALENDLGAEGREVKIKWK